MKMNSVDISGAVSNYMSNASNALFVAVILILVVGYFLRNPLKALVSNFVGYRATLDDYSFSNHRNRDVMYDNSVASYNSVNLKSMVLLFSSFVGALVSPILFAILFLTFVFELTLRRVNKMKDYEIYENLDKNDEFITYLNTKMAKIDLIVNDMLFAGYVLIISALLVENMIIGYVGIALIGAVLVTVLLSVYNAVMYKVNYKYIEFYRVMRLLDSSALGSNQSLFFLGILSFSSNFVESMQGFSFFVWLLLGLKLITSIAINRVLKNDDDLSVKHQALENRDYTNIENVASYPNPISQSRGYKFSTLLQMKFFEIDKKVSNKQLIHIDNYAFYPQTVNRTTMRKNPLLKDTLANSVKISFETLDLAKQLMILGGMGSGKTVTINYIIEQVHKAKFTNYKAIAFNDIKGDFSKDFYREDKDIIVNLYDKRATVWCPFLEMKHNIEAGTSFINNLFESLQGSDKDFFSASAKQKTAQWLQESYFATDSNIEAWELFFNKIKIYEDDIKKRDDKTGQSILATIQIALEILTIMHYQIVIEKRKTFTFNDFVKMEDVQLFFANNKQFEAKLTPYLNGLTATYVNTIMSKEDTKEHLILNVFDEFLTMKIDDATRKTLLTATRSKGFCNLLVAQYLINDEKLIQDLDSSRYALIVFNINDDFTLEKVSKKIAEAEYLQTSSSDGQEKQTSTDTSGGGDGAVASIVSGMISLKPKDNMSYSLSNTKVILEQQLQSMPKFHHLTFIPSEETKVISGIDANRYFKLMVFGYEKLMRNISKTNDFLAKESGILYLGYTPESTLSFENKSFEKWDMRDYYYFNAKKSETIKNDSTCPLNEEERFCHYLEMKFAGSSDEAFRYAVENKLERWCIKDIFKDVEEDELKIKLFIDKTTDEERYELMSGFFDCNTNKEKYEYCKERDLIACISGIFYFSDEYIKDNKDA